MAEAPSLAPSFNVANSVYKTRVGRLKKYEDPWSAMNKRMYILATTLEKLRRVTIRIYNQVMLLRHLCCYLRLCLCHHKSQITSLAVAPCNPITGYDKIASTSFCEFTKLNGFM